MANLTSKDLKRVFYRATMVALGYDPDKAYGKAKPPVRMNYATFGAPDWKLSDDVVFLFVGESSGNDVSTQVHTYWDDADPDILAIHTQTRVLEVTFTAYGPNCYDHLTDIRHRFIDGSTILRDAHIYVVQEASGVTYAPEFFQGSWWERADMTMHFNNLLEWDETVKTIETVPLDIHGNRPGSPPASEPGDVETTINQTGIVIRKDR